MNNQIHEEIKQSIINVDKEQAKRSVTEAIEQKEDPLDLVINVLNPALKEVGDRFDRGELYLPELILASEAMEVAVEVLKPYLEERKQSLQSPGRVVMATVKGDIHDIGKNIVCALLRANGFEVLDLGKDVPASKIVAKAQEFQADIIGLSALLSTTLPYCRDILRLLEDKGVRNDFKVFIGGGAVTEEYAIGIGGLYGGAHAAAAVSNMQSILGR